MIATSGTSKALTALLPVLIFVLGLGVRAVQGPHSLAQNYDPDYAYLFNGLNVLTGKPPAHTDHPGTPLQAMIGGLLAAWNAVTSQGQDTVGHVIDVPDAALSAVNLALLAMLAGWLWLAGLLAVRAGLGLRTALFLQGGLLLFPVAVPFLARVTPEIVLMGVCPVLAVLLLSEGGPGRAVSAGVMYALSVTLKVVAFPLASLGLLLRSRARVAWFAGTATVSALVFVLPAWGRAGEMVRWFESLLTRSGGYGSGELGLPAIGTLAAGARHLIREEPFFVIWPLIALAAAYGSARDRRPAYAAAAGVAIQFALVTKHPEPRYLLPSFTLAALCAALSFGHSEGRRAWVMACWAVLAANLLFSANEARIWAGRQLKFRQELQSLAAEAAKHPECMKAGVYRSSLPTTGLLFADNHSGYAQAERLRPAYPDALELYLGDGGFRRFQGVAATAEVEHHLRAGGCLLVQGTEFHNVRLPGAGAWEVQRIAGTSPAPMAQSGESLYLIRLGGNSTSKSN